jgi:hypothetical protein
MLARLAIHVPFHIGLSKLAKFTVYEYEWQGYTVRVFPPSYTEERSSTDPDELTINDEPAVLANVLNIEFQREAFDRTEDGPVDPPEDVIRHAMLSFINRLRHVTRGFNVRALVFPEGDWRIEYLNNDGSKLEASPGLVRARGKRKFVSASFTGLTPSMWTSIHELAPEYEPPAWEVLLLDAQAELPNIGTATVLAATALEVFIARVLDQLALERQMPRELWIWINNRNDYRQEPTLVEQYDTLLKMLTSHSLKEEGALWEDFQHLKRARNTFVHEGSARFGAMFVDARRAGTLIGGANAIIGKIREWVPDSLRWPVYEHQYRFGFTKAIGSRPSGQQEGAESDKPVGGTPGVLDSN